jgi:hypothetical protein
MAWHIPKTFAELERMSDAELRAKYDEMNEGGTVVDGVRFILEELSRRREARLVLLTWVIAGLTFLVALMTLVITVVTLTD